MSPPAIKRIAVLGSTGSVGQNTLRLVRDRAQRFQVAVLSANRSAAELREQIDRFRPAAACLVGGEPEGYPAGTAAFSGAEGVLEALEHGQPDLVLNAITGAAGLPASEWTLRNGRTLALANKESLVVAGEYLVGLAAETGARILPVDSEHCAIFQCLVGEDRGKVRKVYLTGSGGPFRERALDSFVQITAEEALRHPTWDMGPRITVGSATMMNKAFEVLEAHWLFGLEPDQVQVVIHPQSIVHSMVEFVDGSIMAQLGVPDMRVPILYCLGWPERLDFEFEPFDPVRFANLTFESLDPVRYPAVPLAYETLALGGDSGARMNAADEVMTHLFLEGGVPFPAIAASVARVVREGPCRPVRGLTDVQEADRQARRRAQELAENHT